LTPYYDDGVCTIYLGDCREVLPALDVRPDLVLADPPYGVNEGTDRFTKARGSFGRGGKNWPARDFDPVHGDDQPFDPTHLLGYPHLILFGANYYADRLPTSPSWIIWDKLDGLTSKRPVGFNDNADCELAWTNLGGPARLFRHRWTGLLQGSEIGEPRVHPTQKPVALMRSILDWRTQPGDLILDPYMGSGPVLRAAKDLGRRAIGIEIEERYCEIAAKRLAQEVLDLWTEPAPVVA
jgi:site-specific DNA-methyltransferase (adenine-specific)